MSSTSLLSLPLLAQGQKREEVTVNEAFEIIDTEWPLRWIEEAVTLTGASVSLAGAIPQSSIIEGVCGRITTAATSGDGGSTIKIGDGGDGGGVAADDDRYSSGVGFADGSTFRGVVGGRLVNYSGTVTVQIRPDTGTFSGGVMLVRAYFRALEIPPAP